MIKEEFFVMDYGEYEDLVINSLNLPDDTQLCSTAFESINDGALILRNITKEYDCISSEDDVNNFVNKIVNNSSTDDYLEIPWPSEFLTKLCQEGFIEPGNYMIEISW